MRYDLLFLTLTNQILHQLSHYIAKPDNIDN